MAAKRSMWSKIGKYISAFVVLCFFLPFFGVSCETPEGGMDIITISGADMVGGCRPGGLVAEAEDEGRRAGGGASMGLDMKVEKVDREPLAIAAMALVVIAFGFSILKTRTATAAVLGLSLAAIGALVALYLKVRGELIDEVDKEMAKKKGGEGGEMGSRMMDDVSIDAGGRMGLWGAGLGLVAVVAMTALALKRRDEEAPPTPPPGTLST